MSHSRFVWQPEYGRTILSGHTRTGAEERVSKYTHAVASTLYTTLADYAKFVRALLEAKPGSVFAMEEDKQVEVRPDLDLWWGLGLGIEEVQPASFFHWRSNPGFQSFFFGQPKTHRGVLFLTDSDNGLTLVNTLVSLSVPGTHPALRFPMLHPTD